MVNKKSKKDVTQTQLTTRGDVFESFSDVEPKYATSARSDAIQRDSGLVEYRRAEKLDNGLWNVVAVEIYNAQDIGKTAEEIVQSAEDSSDEDKKYITATVRQLGYSEKGKLDSDKIMDMTFMQAMSLLADLEFMANRYAIKQNAKADTVEAAAEAIAKAYAELDPTDAFLSNDFFAVEHFTDVSEREGVVWTDDLVPKRAKYGRVMKTGTYNRRDLVTANDARLDTIQNPPVAEDLPEALKEAFDEVSDKGNAAERLTALHIISEFDSLYEKLKTLQSILSTYLQSDSVEMDSVFLDINGSFKDYDHAMSSVRSAMERIQKENTKTELFLQNTKNQMFYIDIIVYAHEGAKLMAAVDKDPSLAKEHSNRIQYLQNRIQEIATDYGFSETLVNQAKSAIDRGGVNSNVSLELLDTIISSYAENRQAWMDKKNKDPEQAFETVATMADQKKKPRAAANKR